MYVPFENLSDNARVWIYTAAQGLILKEENEIEKGLRGFAESWQSHHKDILASFKIIKSRFIVVAADEAYNDVSGCGIDKSVHVIQDIENELGISLTDKTLVCFDVQGRIQAIPFQKIKEAVLQGRIEVDTYFYNTLIQTKAELSSQFYITIKDGWVKRYFAPVASV